MICPNCGRESNNNAKYCTFCGAYINPTKEVPETKDPDAGINNQNDYAARHAFLSTDTIEMGIKGRRTLTVENLDRRKDVTWDSSDPNVATVDGSGNVGAQGYGYTVITASVDSTNYIMECDVYVDELMLDIDDSSDYYSGHQYKIGVLQNDSPYIRWESSDESVATIDPIDDRTANLVIHRCGPVTIKAIADGESAAFNPEIYLQKNNTIEIQTEEIVVASDETKIWVASSGPHSIYAVWDDDSILSVDWSPTWRGDVTEAIIRRKRAGTTRIRFYDADENGIINKEVEPKYVTVVCK